MPRRFDVRTASDMVDANVDLDLPTMGGLAPIDLPEYETAPLDFSEFDALMEAEQRFPGYVQGARRGGGGGRGVYGGGGYRAPVGPAPTFGTPTSAAGVASMQNRLARQALAREARLAGMEEDAMRRPVTKPTGGFNWMAGQGGMIDPARMNAFQRRLYLPSGSQQVGGYGPGAAPATTMRDERDFRRGQRLAEDIQRENLRTAQLTRQALATQPRRRTSGFGG